MKRLILLAIVLLSAGCTLNKPVSAGCARLDNYTSDTPIAISINGAGPGVSLAPWNAGSNWCNSTSLQCNVTLSISGNLVSMVVPACTNDQPQGCILNTCAAQTCGNFFYSAAPVASQEDIIKMQSDLSNGTSSPYLSNEVQGVTPGLYDKRCSILTGTDIDNVLKNTKGTFVNTFRLGVGDTFEEFERYRWMFPMSDRYCGTGVYTGGTDRYQNYLLSPKDYLNMMGGQSYPVADVIFQNFSYCMQKEESPFVGQDYNGSIMPGYKDWSVSNWGYVYSPPTYNSSGGMVDPPMLTALDPVSFTESDPYFYASILPLMYNSSVQNGSEAVAGEPVRAPFECDGPGQCYSGNCDYNYYYRKLCKLKTQKPDGTMWVNCGCDAAGRNCLGENTIYNPLGKNGSYSDVLNAYLNAYMTNNQSYIVHNQTSVDVTLYDVDPSCSGNPYSDCNDIRVPGCSGGTYCPHPATNNPLTSSTYPVPPSSTFPNGIYFFGEKDQGYIGYSLLREDSFKQTDFYQVCHPHYDAVSANSTFAAEECNTGMVSHPPLDKIPENLGDLETSSPACHTLGNDHLDVEVVDYWILIKDMGDCDNNTEGTLPITKALGWCDACSYSTFAKQSVTSGNAYNPLLTQTALNVNHPFTQLNYSFNQCKLQEVYVSLYSSHIYDVPDPVSTLPTKAGSGIYVDVPKWLWCDNNTIPDPYLISSNYSVNPFNSYPDGSFLQSKETEYLKEGVMPVLDISDGSNWDSGDNLVLSGAVLNRGPNILIIDKISGNFDQTKLQNRYNSAHTACGKCLIAAEMTYGTPNAENISDRINSYNETLQNLVASSVMGELNIVAFEYYPQEVTLGYPAMCNDNDNFIRDSEMFPFLENLTSMVHTETGKPSLVSDFYIDPSVQTSCWDSNHTSAFLSYMFLKQLRLARQGNMGIIDTNVDPTFITGGSYNQEFCSAQIGSRYMYADSPVTVYNKAYAAAPGANVTCEACTASDLILNLCTQSCVTGANCTLDTSDPNYQALKAQGVPDSKMPYKCPTEGVPTQCVPCSQMPSNENVSCTEYHTDGSVTFVNAPLNNLTDGWPDIISSIPDTGKPNQFRCCLNDSVGNYTYVKVSTIGKVNAPIMYDVGGDPNNDCGLADLSDLNPNMCGAQTPIENYNIKCQFVGG